MYIGTNVLMYERWLVQKVKYTAGCPASRPTLSPFHRMTLLVHVSKKIKEKIGKKMFENGEMTDFAEQFDQLYVILSLELNVIETN